MHRSYRALLHDLAPALRAALSLLLVVSVSALCLHTHAPQHDHHHHDHEHHGEHAPTDDQHSEAPCANCVLLAGLVLPTFAVTLSSPSCCVSTQLRAPVDAAPRSILSWSSRLLRAPPQFA